MFTTDIALDGDRALVGFRGELDMTVVDRARAAIDEAMGSGAIHLEIDLGDLTLLCSAGVSVLLHARRITDTMGGSVTLLSSTGAVAKVIDTLHLGTILNVQRVGDGVPGL